MSISAILITKNEEKLLSDCLNSLNWVNEIIIVDSFSTDRTLEIARKFTHKIYQVKEQDFSKRRNEAITHALGEWLLYVDADEKITSDLKKEILKVIEANSDNANAYAIPRENIMFGRWLKHGGWYPDYQIRLFRKGKLKFWQGALHETPIFDGEAEKLNNSIIHYTHKSISETLNKKLEWSGIEAILRLKANHPKITWPRILKVMTTEFIKRFFLLSGWKDGTEGLIASVDEAFSLFVIYTKLWELQSHK